ncbi:MAG TPA: cytochrome P460 family protein [Candidatus Baltobacteraceae bacterium]|nr:cytochrome P460 family protein [Candidatus Baltobacteraceae bacterium]
MKRILPLVMVTIALALAVSSGRTSSAQEKQDRYTLQIPGGLSFSEIRGYETWQVVAPSLTDSSNVIRVIVANPVMINAYREGVPANGKPFPDGSKIVKLEWRPKKLTTPPFSASTPDTVPGDLTAVEFIVKDSKRFPDTHGWGYATFDYNAAAGTFAPANENSKPPVGHDAKCGAACHTLAARTDYIFTAYPKR